MPSFGFDYSFGKLNNSLVGSGFGEECGSFARIVLKQPTWKLAYTSKFKAQQAAEPRLGIQQILGGLPLPAHITRKVSWSGG